MTVEIIPAYGYIKEIRELFTEYAAWIGSDLAFQNFSTELKTLPSSYALPEGRLYIALAEGVPAGCIALKKLDSERCEMKRLYVRPSFRNNGIGNELVSIIIDEAKKIGYRHMLLDTLTTFEKAVSIYRQRGFCETEPYCTNPWDNVIYLKLDL